LTPGTSASTSRRTEGTHGFARAAAEILAALASSSRVISPVLQSDFEFTFIPVSGAASAAEMDSELPPG
jgi:hypothetical protein